MDRGLRNTSEPPIGVVLIALPYFLQALAIVLLALALKLKLGAELMYTLFGIPPQLVIDDRSLVIVILLGIALVSAMMGYGIWNFRPWARRVCLYTTGLSLLRVCVRLFSQAGNLDAASAAYRLFWAVVGALIIWYLWQPDIKARFQSPGRATSDWHRPGMSVSQEAALARVRAITGRPAVGRITPYKAAFRQQ